LSFINFILFDLTFNSYKLKHMCTLHVCIRRSFSMNVMGVVSECVWVSRYRLYNWYWCCECVIQCCVCTWWVL